MVLASAAAVQEPMFEAVALPAGFRRPVRVWPGLIPRRHKQGKPELSGNMA
jgi:hypothetical protein